MRPGATLLFYGAVGAALTCGTALVRPAEPAATNAPGNQVLLNDNFGQLIVVPTNAVSSQFFPSPGISITNEIPSPTPGTPIPEPVQERERDQRAGRDELQFFPPFAPRLAPYLASVDQFGNTVLKPGALIPWAPNDVLPQRAKYWASEFGLRYSLQQTITYVQMTDVMQGDNTLGYYTLSFAAKWAVYNDPPSATAGWFSTQIKVKTGLNDSGDTQSARSNLGTITDPTGLWSGFNGIAVQELAWQQSFRDGQLVFLGSASAGQAPWTDFSFNNWSAACELGYMPKNVHGLGPGVYRAQPFVARVGDALGSGLCFNAQQQMGEHTPIGWYGRFGFGSQSVTAGAAAQVGTGFVIRGPLEQLGLAPARSNDGVGVGFVWSQPSASSAMLVHENEFGIEADYVLQLTPMAKLQSDFQVIWNPAYNPGANHAFVLQIQLEFAW